MRNYFKRLNIPSFSDSEALQNALLDPNAKLSDEGREDARAILTDDALLKMYQRMFTQYEAMRASIDCIEASPGIDTNHWLARLNNFDPDPQEQLLP